MIAKNFCDFFCKVVNNFGPRNAIFWRNTNNSSGDKSKYSSITGNKLKELVYHTAKAIENLNLNPGDKAAIISETRFEWAVTDFACIANRLITVPIYPTMTSSQMKFIIEHSEAKVCFVSTKLIADKIKAVYDELPGLNKIITFNKTENEPDSIINFEDLIYSSVVHSKESYSEAEADKYFSGCADKSVANDILTIIYTSGTTGNPKGVSLTHKNILVNVEQCQKAFPMIGGNDRFLSFLPLAHCYERTTGYYFPLSVGAELYYAQSIDTLQAQFPEIKPTLVTAVPLLFTRIYTRLIKNVEAMSSQKQLLVKSAFNIAKKYKENKNGLLWRTADKFVLKTIREKTGGAIKFFISGGSALNKDIGAFFYSLGINVYEGYGMTEASPVIAVNRVGKNKFGTVGLPLDGIEVKIAGDGEILVKGENVMNGYNKNEKDTNETIIDGWLHTGDIGELDSDGYLKITDRKKSLIKTEGGKYISLTHIEEALENSRYIEQVISFAGDDKPFVSALIVPDMEELHAYAKQHNISYNNDKELTAHEQILKLFEKEINDCQRHHAKYERVRKFTLMDTPFTIEKGEMTPSLKLRRKIIEEKYRDLIYKMYKAVSRESRIKS
jgi:long-chain acyl-CoA synthetase